MERARVAERAVRRPRQQVRLKRALLPRVVPPGEEKKGRDENDPRKCYEKERYTLRLAEVSAICAKSQDRIAWDVNQAPMDRPRTQMDPWMV